jgi:hypothetical protein
MSFMALSRRFTLGILMGGIVTFSMRMPDQFEAHLAAKGFGDAVSVRAAAGLLGPGCFIRWLVFPSSAH